MMMLYPVPTAEITNKHKCSLQALKERDHMENVDVDEMMILKWVSGCSGVEWI
jgi:hypothetical protein